MMVSPSVGSLIFSAPVGLIPRSMNRRTGIGPENIMKGMFREVVYIFSLVSVLSGIDSNCTRTNDTIGVISKSLDINLMNLSIDEVIHQITARRACCVDLTRFFLRRIELYNPIFNVAITVDGAGSLREAKKLDEYYELNGGNLKGRLHCVPILVKDNIFVKGLPTTLGVRLFSDAIANEDAPAIARLRKEGAIILGKANMIMFAAGSTDVGSETGGLVRNPYALNYTVVGSSTGNAAAVAARLAVIGIGSDSGGSITAPASATNTFGLRPPSGSVDTRDVFPLLGQPFDVIGPIALNVKDIVTVTDVLQTGVYRDSTKFDRSLIRLGILHSLTYGVVNVSSPPLDSGGYLTTSTYSVDPEIQQCFQTFQTRLSVLSETYNIKHTVLMDDIVELAGPVLENENHRWSCVLSDMTRFLRQHPMRSSTGVLIDDASKIVTDPSTPFYYRVLLGYLSKRTKSCSSSRERYALRLSAVRRRLRRQIFDQGVDLLVMPTLNALLWSTIGENSNSSADDDSSYPHSNGHLHDLGGLFALPALNVPLCFSKPRPGAAQGLPIGAYIMTVPENLGAMLEFARIYERVYGTPKVPDLIAE